MTDTLQIVALPVCLIVYTGSHPFKTKKKANRQTNEVPELKSTSKNQSYKAKKRGRPNRSDTAPSAVGIDSRLPPLRKFVSKLLALSRRFHLVLGSSVLVDWHLYHHKLIIINEVAEYAA